MQPSMPQTWSHRPAASLDSTSFAAKKYPKQPICTFIGRTQSDATTVSHGSSFKLIIAPSKLSFFHTA